MFNEWIQLVDWQREQVKVSIFIRSTSERAFYEDDDDDDDFDQLMYVFSSSRK